jgi:hypothetical protein
MGVVFYEMLTGVPPFRGDSVGEVLMKHVAGDPDLSHIAQPLANVIRKAMNKDPRQRYQSVDQMVSDVLSCAGVDAGLASVSPDDLSMIAKRELRTAAVPTHQNPPPRNESHNEFAAFTSPAMPNRVAQNTKEGFFHHLNLGLHAFCSASGLSRQGWPDYWGPVRDPVDRVRRMVMAAFAVAFFVAFPTMLFQDDQVFAVLAVLIGGGTLVLLIAKWLLLPTLESNASLVYRILFGLIGSVYLIVSSMALADSWRRNGDFMVAMGVLSSIPLWLIDWRVMSSPIRPKRLTFTPVFAVALLAIFPPAMWVIAGIAIAVQLGSQYDPALSQRFGLSFPWFQHFLTALRSLSKPRQHAVPSTVQGSSAVQNQPLRAPATFAAKDMQTNGSAQLDTMPHSSNDNKDWELPARIAASLHKIPVNQYSAVIADSLVKASGSLKRFLITSACLTMIGAAWLILVATCIGVPQLFQNTVSQQELVKIEQVFGHGDWTPLVIRVARMVALLLLVPAIAILLPMRFKSNRERGWQTVFATCILGVSLLVLGQSFKFGSVWHPFGMYLRGGEQGYALNRLMDDISLMGIFFGLLTTMVGVYFLLVGFRSSQPTPQSTLPTHGATPSNTIGQSPESTCLEASESDPARQTILVSEQSQ